MKNLNKFTIFTIPIIIILVFLTGCANSGQSPDFGKIIRATHQAADPEWYKYLSELETQKARREYWKTRSPDSSIGIDVSLWGIENELRQMRQQQQDALRK